MWKIFRKTTMNNEWSKLFEIPEELISDITSVDSLRDLYEKRRDSLGLSDRQVLKILDIEQKSLSLLLDGKAKQINLLLMIKLGHFLGLSIGDMVKVYGPRLSKEQIGDIQRARDGGFIMEFFDIASLQKEKFLKRDMSSMQISERIRNFFGLDSIYDYASASFGYALSRTKNSKDNKMRDFWLKSAFVMFKGIANPNPYNRHDLLSLIPRIKPYSRDVELGLHKVLRALYHLGVTVIYQPSLTNLQIRGATMIVDGKPCIVLSNFRKMYPTLWFALLHELHHVLFDSLEIEQQIYHISDSGEDLFLMNEERADNFARQFFLDDSRMKFIHPYIGSEYHVQKYAKEWGIHPSLIYAFHCFDTKQWGLFSQHIPDMTSAIKHINASPFDKETLQESIKYIKETIFKDI